MVVSKNIYYRFESEINNGTLYIFDIIKQKIIKSNYFSYLIISNIDKNKSYSEIIAIISEVFKDYSKNEIEGLLNQGIEYLKKYEVLE
ncbi:MULTISPECIES: hypothetical protein [Clostridium]|uniref:PqqD family protein n=4 Tax=Clostridium perfringens TaxID=1502 RepID=K9MF58_CLOPF|nr:MULTISPECIES: hypothetical protein [Clostridium]MDU7440236.1 hypothetical protein [Clostridium sp.]AFV15153.1 hypothetical protein pCpb2-CP1_65 [Clostridium perfringens]AQW28463.1 hypothetical protein BXT94_17205 [Clostridium perfringens]EDT14784.1 conserved hypothetical protein [Clostridium perfringens E str. JGS1987]EGT3601902.1 hypothetical protein [Clostridium perfringens]